MTTISSAEPHALFRYADTGTTLNDRLEFEASRLRSALAHFVSTCTEYQIGVDTGLADELQSHSRSAGATDAWVRRVGAAFQTADQGSIIRNAWRAAVDAQRAAEHAATPVDDAAGWLFRQGANQGWAVLRRSFGAIRALATAIINRLAAYGRLTGGAQSFTICHDGARPRPSLWERAGDWLGRAGRFIADLWRKIADKFSGLIRQLMGGWRFLEGVARRLAPKLLRAAVGAWRWLRGFSPTALAVGLAIRLVRWAWPGIRETIRKGIAFGKEVFGTVRNLFFSGGRWLMDKARGAGEWVLDRAKDTGTWLWDRAKDAGNWLWDRAKDAGSWIMDNARKLWDKITGFVQQIKEAFGKVWKILGNVAKTILEVVKEKVSQFIEIVKGAVKWVFDKAISGVRVFLDLVVEVFRYCAWNTIAVFVNWSLDVLLIGVDLLKQNPILLLHLVFPLCFAVLMGSFTILTSPFGISLLVTGGILFATGTLDDLISIPLQFFWDSVQYVNPELLREIARKIDKLLKKSGIFKEKTRNESNTENMRPNGTLELSANQVFPEDYCRKLPDGSYAITPGAIMAGEHSIISSYKGEQVSLSQIGEHEFLLGINGLDLNNMSTGSPNNIESVIETAFWNLETQSFENEYYRLVRERFLQQLAHVQPGSVLNLTGHSMGAGMTLLLLNDPVVQECIRVSRYHVRSVTTYGMVRPKNADRLPDIDIYQGTIVKDYVDPDDRLAVRVGAGHDSRKYDTVRYVDDPPEVFFEDEPTISHTTYERKEYDKLPQKDRELPFTVDPEHFQMFWRSGR